MECGGIRGGGRARDGPLCRHGYQHPRGMHGCRIPSWLLHDLIRGNEHVLQRVLDGVGLAVDSVLKKAEHGLDDDSESDAAPRPLDAIAGAIGRLRSDTREDGD